MFKTIRKWLQSEQRYTYFSNDPRAARHWHNPADPVQADRIEAAAARREERAEKQLKQAARSSIHNEAHKVRHELHDGHWTKFPVLRLNPFHVAH